MKKRILSALCVLVIFVLAACGSSDGATDSASSKSGSTTAGGTESETEGASFDAAEGIDIDLTQLSSTMIYSEVYNMMASPDDYIGKTVKMSGSFTSFHDENTGNDYFACIIQDATACCSQGIEFVLNEKYIYPDDYPELQEDITVVGVFDTYMEGEMKYCTLRNAELV